MTVDALTAVLALGCTGVLVAAVLRRGHALGGIDRTGAAMLVAAAFVFWRLVGRLVVGALAQDWNAARLAPTIAMVSGYALYYPAHDGPILDTIYGPVAALAYLPAAVFRHPTPVVLTGALLNLLFLLGPLLLFALRAAHDDIAGRLQALAGWLGACGLMTRSIGMHYWLSMVHADGPALGLGLLACLAVVPPRRAPTLRLARIDAAAVLAVLAAWAKQTSAPLGVGLAAVVWWRAGGAAARRYVTTSIFAALALAIVFSTAFGPEPLWFNLLVVPGHQPWIRPGLAGLLGATQDLASAGRELWLLLAIGVTLGFVGRRHAAVALCTTAIVAALALVPGSAIAANKVGGAQNSFHSLYFLLAAGLAVVVGSDATAARAITHLFCATSLLLAVVLGKTDLRQSPPVIEGNPQQQAFDYARAHPGTTFFPSQPLAALLAEGRLDHFSYGLVDRVFADYGPTTEHFRRYLPPAMQRVASRKRDWVMRYLPEYSVVETTAELPGWTLFTQPQRTGSQPP